MSKKTYIISGLFFLSLSVLLVIYELIALSAKSGHATAETHLDYPFEGVAEFIHSVVGYKLIFPAIGLIIIALISYIVAPYLTKKEERP
ncbi:MAG: hypothetical protein ACK5LE_00190 [Alphaproteobacteria bacterium]